MTIVIGNRTIERIVWETAGVKLEGMYLKDAISEIASVLKILEERSKTNGQEKDQDHNDQEKV